jgi:hypothetical protein
MLASQFYVKSVEEDGKFGRNIESNISGLQEIKILKHYVKDHIFYKFNISYRILPLTFKR